MESGTKNHEKNLISKNSKDIDQKVYSSDYYNVSVNKHGVKCGKLLRF